jgi:hypothetical protein
MENMIKGLDLEELEAHSYVELLPDRIEMHRRRRSVHRRHKRRRSGNVECTATNVGGLVNRAFNIQACSRINA